MALHVSAHAVGQCSVDAHDARRIGYGDWQTDSEFASFLCRKLREWGPRPTVILEPTCGIGNFAAAALEVFADSVRAVYCIEINEEYLLVARSRLELMARDVALSGGGGCRIVLLQRRRLLRRFEQGLFAARRLLAHRRQPAVGDVKQVGRHT